MRQALSHGSSLHCGGDGGFDAAFVQECLAPELKGCAAAAAQARSFVDADGFLWLISAVRRGVPMAMVLRNGGRLRVLAWGCRARCVWADVRDGKTGTLIRLVGLHWPHAADSADIFDAAVLELREVLRGALCSVVMGDWNAQLQTAAGPADDRGRRIEKSPKANAFDD